MSSKEISRAQYISSGNTQEEQLLNIQNALVAGVSWVQLRFKNASDELFLATAIEAQMLCKKMGAVFLINDKVSVAKEIKADGVHLGLTDCSIVEARDVLGKEAIIGLTANTLQDVLLHIENKADYVGLGPFKFTQTKKKLSPILGIEGYQDIIKGLQEAQVSIPIVGVGGITLDDIPALIQVGLHGIAFSSLLTQSSNQLDTYWEVARRISENIASTYVNNSR